MLPSLPGQGTPACASFTEHGEGGSQSCRVTLHQQQQHLPALSGGSSAPGWRSREVAQTWGLQSLVGTGGLQVCSRDDTAHARRLEGRWPGSSWDLRQPLAARRVEEAVTLHIPPEQPLLRVRSRSGETNSGLRHWISGPLAPLPRGCKGSHSPVFWLSW